MTFCLCILSSSVYAQTQGADLTSPRGFQDAWEQSNAIPITVVKNPDERVALAKVPVNGKRGYYVSIKPSEGKVLYVECVALRVEHSKSAPDDYFPGISPVLLAVEMPTLSDAEALLMGKGKTLPTDPDSRKALLLDEQSKLRFGIPYMHDEISRPVPAWGFRVRVMYEIPSKSGKSYSRTEYHIALSFAASPSSIGRR